MTDSEPPKIGFLIPEFPGQTHSFFWREISLVQKEYGLKTEIFSTRLPPQPVEHEWVKDVNPRYLYPFNLQDYAFALKDAFIRIPKFLFCKDSWQVLKSPKTWALLAMAMKLGRQIKASGVDHLHIHSCANSALLGVMCHKMYGVPYSLVLHGPFSDYGDHQKYKWRHAEFVFVITDLLYQEALVRMPDLADKIHIVPMGVDTDRFAPLSVAPAKDFKGFTWFCCARLNKVKGFDTLLPAVEQVMQTEPNLKFRVNIAGEDEQGGSGYRKVLETEIASRGLDGTVSLLGAIPQAEVLKNLQHSDGFVLASMHEPLGVVYMEAMSCGLPTVGTDAGGVSELISSGKDGLLVPPNDPSALADAMLQVMTNPGLRASLGEKGRQTVEQRFSSSRSAQRLVELMIASRGTTNQ